MRGMPKKHRALDMEIVTPLNPDKLWTETWKQIEQHLRDEVRAACRMGKLSARVILMVKDKE